jgi:hypothetical protein
MTPRIAIAVALLASLAEQVQAQTPPVASPEWLDRMAAQRNQERRVQPEQPAPVPTPKEVILPTHGLWVCMGTAPWQPVLNSPSPSSPAIGQTQSQIAVNGATANGYAQVLFYNGRIGYVPISSIHAYHSDVNPRIACAVAGVRPNGAPVFAYR